MQHKSRPDIRAIGKGGATDWLEVTVLHSLTSNKRLRDVARYPRTILESAVTKKFSQHRDSSTP